MGIKCLEHIGLLQHHRVLHWVHAKLPWWLSFKDGLCSLPFHLVDKIYAISQNISSSWLVCCYDFTDGELRDFLIMLSSIYLLRFVLLLQSVSEKMESNSNDHNLKKNDNVWVHVIYSVWMHNLPSFRSSAVWIRWLNFCHWINILVEFFGDVTKHFGDCL